jgi:hypothetical protein
MFAEIGKVCIDLRQAGVANMQESPICSAEKYLRGFQRSRDAKRMPSNSSATPVAMKVQS